MGVLDGRTIAVTGAAGGIGGAVAAAYAREGALVTAIDLPSDRLTQIARDIGATAVQADVTDERSITEAMEAAAPDGRLDVLFASAGVQLHGADASVHELDLEVWERTMRINLTGVFLSMKHAIRHMLPHGAGSLVVCGSPTAINGSGAGYDAYSASKGGVHALVRSASVAYAKRGIRVNAVVPGATRTPLIAELLDDPQWLATLESGTPMGRIGEPDDVVGAAVLLASDASSFMTGSVVTVDGGITIR